VLLSLLFYSNCENNWKVKKLKELKKRRINVLNLIRELMNFSLQRKNFKIKTILKEAALSLNK